MMTSSSMNLHKKLSQFEPGLCEEPLTKEECLKAVKEMECNKKKVPTVYQQSYTKFSGKTYLISLLTLITVHTFAGIFLFLKNTALSNLSQNMILNFILLKIGAQYLC